MFKNKKIIAAMVITAVLSAGITAVVCGYVLPYVLGTGGGSISRAEQLIAQSFYKEVDEKTIRDAAISGMMSALEDDYSYYLNEESFSELIGGFDGEYTGIGVEVSIDSKDNLITVIAPIEDTPAAVAGIGTGDKILKVNGIAVSMENYPEAIKLMRGSVQEIGQDIVLLIRKSGVAQDTELVLKRQKIVIKTVKYKMLENGVGYIRLTKFDNGTDEEFKTALEALKSTGMSRLVIDLRNNPGGVFDACKNIADMLLPKGLLVSFEYKDGKKDNFYSDESSLDIPIAILMNEGSASASEVLAAAMKDYHKATIVGTKSYGKGVVQSVLPISADENGSSALYMTTSRWLSPLGECIHGVGISPDIAIDLPESLKDTNIGSIEQSKDVQLSAAIDAISQQ